MSETKYGWEWALSSTGWTPGVTQIVFITCVRCVNRTARTTWGNTPEAKWVKGGFPNGYLLSSGSSPLLYILAADDEPCTH